MGLLQSGDAASAARMMEELTRREPANGRNWRVLGQIYLQTKEADEALKAYQKSLEVDPSSMPFIGLAAACALKNDREQASSWLEKAKASKRIDMSQLEHEPAFAAWRDDPKFKTFLPTPADFEHPFVEDVKIIHEWDGESSNDQFGWIARSIGDVNHDGVLDFVTSAPTKAIGGDNAGRVYVYSTKDGKLLWKVDGRPGDMLGSGIEAAGDTNQDGAPDVIASAPGAGKAYIYSGDNGHVLQEFTAEKKEDSFGQHVASVGDIDGDGCEDVIIGAPSNSARGENAGRAYVFSGKDGHVIETLTGERAGDQFGSAVSGSPGTKSGLVIVGAPGAGPHKNGRAYVYAGASTKPKFVIDADPSGVALGAMFLSVIGDVDKDGYPDVYASDWSDRAKGDSTGRIYIYSGKDGHRVRAIGGETAGEGFGTNPGKVGDVDRDGYDDVLVGSWQFAGVANSAGRICLYSGKDGKLLKTYTCRVPGDTLGFDAVGMGDIDGDGAIDLLVTSGWSGIHGFHCGRVFLISSGVRPPLKPN
jgi:FG-GAP repeat/Tetratricopeptide repeat/FG-GAP-like repeat